MTSCSDERKPFIFQFPATSGLIPGVILTPLGYTQALANRGDKSIANECVSTALGLATVTMDAYNTAKSDWQLRVNASRTAQGRQFMLNALRSGAKSWVAKILLGLLVLSFGVWGISGTMFQGTGDTVLEVGDTRVTPIDYRLAYNRQLAIMSRNLGTRLTTDQARAFGIPNMVLGQVASDAALDEQSRRMNLGLSRDRLAGIIADDPAFRGIDGRFDRVLFSNLLRNVGMTEDEFIVSQENAAIRSQIVEAVSDGYEAPTTLLNAIYTFNNEKRTLDYLVLNAGLTDPVSDPDSDTLSRYFEANKSAYRAPEYRRIAYVTLLADDIADPSTIDDAMVRADYQARIDRYTEPEQRTVEQLIFLDNDAARAAAEAMAAGTAFEQLVEEQGRTMADVRLGTFRKDSVPDPAIADAAFAIGTVGGTSGVVEGSFGPVILRVTEIVPQTTRGFDEVKEEIRNEMALVDAGTILLDVHDAYEDARAAGATLEEAARNQRLTPVVIEAVDRTARTPDGTILTELPESRTLLARVFDTDIGVESAPLNIGSEGFLWYEVQDIIPDRDRTLDEVRGRVITDWKNEQTAQALGSLATGLQQRLEDGEALADIASELGLSVETKYDLSRNDPDAVFGNAALATVFSGPEGLVAVADDAGGQSKILMQINEVTAPDMSGDLTQTVAASVSQSMGNDLLNQAVGLMQAEFGLSYNPTAAELAISSPY